MARRARSTVDTRRKMRCTEVRLDAVRGIRGAAPPGSSPQRGLQVHRVESFEFVSSAVAPLPSLSLLRGAWSQSRPPRGTPFRGGVSTSADLDVRDTDLAVHDPQSRCSRLARHPHFEGSASTRGPVVATPSGACQPANFEGGQGAAEPGSARLPRRARPAARRRLSRQG